MKRDDAWHGYKKIFQRYKVRSNFAKAMRTNSNVILTDLQEKLGGFHTVGVKLYRSPRGYILMKCGHFLNFIMDS